MADRNEVLVRFRAQTGEFISDTQKIIDQLRIVQEVLQLQGRGSTGLGSVDLSKTAADAREAGKELDRLNARLELLNEIRKRGEGSRGRIAISAQEQAAAGFEPGTQAVTRKAITEAERAAEADINQILEQRTKLEQEIQTYARQNEQLAQRLLSHATARQFVEERIAEVATGQFESSLIDDRIRALERAREQLLATRQVIASQVTGSLGSTAGGRLEKQRVDAHRLLVNSEEQLERINDRIASLQRRASDERIRGTTQQVLLEERISRLRQQQEVLVADRERAVGLLAGTEPRMEAAVEATGAREQLDEINRLIEENQQQLNQALRGNLADFAPEFDVLRSQLIEIIRLESQGKDVTEEKLRILTQMQDLQRNAAERDIPTNISPEAFRERQLASLPSLERTLFNAFDDVGRRFRTALQFAISGAIIFGAQKLVREFAQAAIEVERTFADIESALEFDLADEGMIRGTVAFNQQVESIRREVLQLANEFNVLPSEANDAAFKMIARFQESESALAAIRAQFLATKISTIDQNEAIRALSATAEGFAASVLEANDAMTLQERLLAREKAAAEGYGAALDEAVLIQQRFGVEVEDVLEGTARAAETFRQLGFNRQETSAAVSAVSRSLGQTGANVAERLNRAFGGLTDPSVRDALLELAAASDDFQLSIEDFGSGAQALQAIDRQIRELERIDPQVVNQIRDILGQRRETEVVAAFFGTSDLRKQMEAAVQGAAGAAERRFGFLEATISERIQSIIAEFESLAQNFERLQLLAPLKLFLGGINFALEAANNLLLFINDLFMALDRFGDNFGVKLGSVLKNLLVTALAITSIIRTAGAALTVVGVARGGVAALQQRGIQGLESGRAGGLLAGLAPILGQLGISAKEAGGGMKGIVASLKVLGAGLVAAARAIPAFIASLILRIPGVGGSLANVGTAMTIGKFVTAIGAAALVVDQFSKSVAAGRDSVAAAALIDRNAETRARQREATQPFTTPGERAAFVAQGKLEDELAAAAEHTRGAFGQALVGVFPAFDEAIREELGGWGPALAETVRGFFRFETEGSLDQRAEEDIPGSKEWWDARIEAAERGWREAQIQAVSDGINTIRDQTLSGDDQEAAANIMRALAAAQAQVAAAETPEELDLAGAEVDAVSADLAVFLERVSAMATGTEGTVRLLREELNRLGRDRETGRVAEFLAPSRLISIETRAREKAEQLRQSASANTGETQQEIADALEVADDAMLQRIQITLESFQRERTRIGRIRDPAARLEREAESLRQELDFLRKEGLTGSTEWLDTVDELSGVLGEAADTAQENAITAARHNVAMATNLADWIAAQNVLAQLIGEGAEDINSQFANLDPADRKFFPAPEIPAEEAARVAREQELIAKEQQDRINEEAQRVAEARVRLAGPIKNRITAIAAQIARLRVVISQGFFSPGEAMEATVQLRELLADRAEAEAEAVAANIRAQITGENSIRSLQAELVIVARQMDLVARLYGRNSAEFANLKAAQDRFKQSLIAAQLELEDIQRRLGSDITSDFAQAQLDLVEIIRQLNNLDLGPLEKARLELEKKQAESRAVRAFFDDRLFQLRFDFETGEIGTDAYVRSLQKLLKNVDTSTQQGKELFLEITNLIDGLTEDVSDMQFNIPAEIRLPTIFEIRRALAADQLGVNYMDNRTQTITVEVSSNLELAAVLQTIDTHFGEATDTQFRRSAVGGSTIVPGSF